MEVRHRVLVEALLAADIVANHSVKLVGVRKTATSAAATMSSCSSKMVQLVSRIGHGGVRALSSEPVQSTPTRDLSTSQSHCGRLMVPRLASMSHTRAMAQLFRLKASCLVASLRLGTGSAQGPPGRSARATASSPSMRRWQSFVAGGRWQAMTIEMAMAMAMGLWQWLWLV